MVRAEGIRSRQTDSEERVWGPAKSAPEVAVAGFVKKQGIAVDQLELISDGKAEKYSYVRKIAGRAASDVLAKALPDLVLKTPFPKTMYWPGKGGARFIRPIRWIVALLDDQVVPFTIAGVPAGNQSSGPSQAGRRTFPGESVRGKLRNQTARKLCHSLRRGAPQPHSRCTDEIQMR